MEAGVRAWGLQSARVSPAPRMERGRDSPPRTSRAASPRSAAAASATAAARTPAPFPSRRGTPRVSQLPSIRGAGLPGPDADCNPRPFPPFAGRDSPPSLRGARSRRWRRPAGPAAPVSPRVPPLFAGRVSAPLRQSICGAGLVDRRPPSHLARLAALPAPLRLRMGRGLKRGGYARRVRPRSPPRREWRRRSESPAPGMDRGNACAHLEGRAGADRRRALEGLEARVSPQESRPRMEGRRRSGSPAPGMEGASPGGP